MQYDLIIKTIKNQITNEKDNLARISNILAIIFEYVNDISRIGFYFKKEDLVLGPFQGKAACTRLNGKGVCWKSFIKEETIIIDDVTKEKDHIFCDSNSKSEIVTVIYNGNTPVGVLDCDSAITHRFKKEDRAFFEEITNILSNEINFSKFTQI